MFATEDERMIAVLMACHNRRDTTVECIRRLLQQKDISEHMRLFLVDDGSTDGTSTAVRSVMPHADIISADGNLFWAAAMSLAEQHAMRERPAYLLWLNDDTFLDHDAVTRMMLASYRHPEAIIVGATRDPVSGLRTYGGRRRVGWHPQRLRDVPISATYEVADTFNGNVVLIPIGVRYKVGAIDGEFPHAYADDDYGLRATALGVSVIQPPGTVGTCAHHPPFLDASLGVIARWQQLESPQGLPFRAQYRFLRRHAGPLWPLILVGGYVHRLFVSR